MDAGLTLEPKSDTMDIALWTEEVRSAAVEWTEVGCPIDVASDGLPVVAWYAEGWPHPLYAQGAASAERVDVRVDLPADRRRQILLHEIGHVLGFHHRETGIMKPDGRVDALTVEDCVVD